MILKNVMQIQSIQGRRWSLAFSDSHLFKRRNHNYW